MSPPRHRYRTSSCRGSVTTTPMALTLSVSNHWVKTETSGALLGIGIGPTFLLETVITLLLIPINYLILEDIRRLFRRDRESAPGRLQEAEG